MYEYPSDEVLTASVEKNGVSWTAHELGIPEAPLRRHMKKQGLPTKALSVKLEASDEMKQIAGLLK
jgi:hypothetical protein